MGGGWKVTPGKHQGAGGFCLNQPNRIPAEAGPGWVRHHLRGRIKNPVGALWLQQLRGLRARLLIQGTCLCCQAGPQ